MGERRLGALGVSLCAAHWELVKRARAAGAPWLAIPYAPHLPHPKQREFLRLLGREALYGGAVGGGKSDALLLAALMYVDRPGYSAILFRRTHADLALPGALMDRAQAWLGGTDAAWNGAEKRWTFPSGATLVFGYMDIEQDKLRYKSAEFQFVGFDELTQFSETQYLYMFSRMRRLKGSDVPVRMRGATNPGDVGHAWVKARFGITDSGVQMARWTEKRGDIDREVTREMRPFVPSKLRDNPSIDAEEYIESLAELDTATLDQLEKGLWITDAAGRVYRFARGANETSALPRVDAFGVELLPREWRYGLGIDLGSSEIKPTTAFVEVAWHPRVDVTYVTRAWAEPGMIPSTMAERVGEVRKLRGDALELITLDEGALGKGYGGEMRQRYRIPVVPAEKSMKLGYRRLMNGAFQRGKVQLLPDAEPLSAECESLLWRPDGLDNIKGQPNHLSDAALYIWRASRAHRAEASAPPPPPHTREWYEARAREIEARERAQWAERERLREEGEGYERW